MNPVLMDVLPFVRQGFCCSQLLMLLMLQARGEENPALVRSFRASGHGNGHLRGLWPSRPAAPVCWLCSAARGVNKEAPPDAEPPA